MPYDHNLGVIRLWHAGEKEYRFFVGYGNLLDADFTFQPLTDCGESVHAQIAALKDANPGGRDPTVGTGEW